VAEVSTTRRFRAHGSIPYAQALLVLVDYARTVTSGFAFGPIGSVPALRHNGLTVSGPETVVGEVARLLEREVPGLYEAD
jgi:hypothetical protein